MAENMTESTERGITINKALAWTMLVSVIGLIWWGGGTLAVERQPPWPVPTTTLAGGAGRKTGMPVWRAAPPA